MGTRQAGTSGNTCSLTESQVKRVRAVLYLNGMRGADLDDAAQDVQVRLLEAPGPIDNVAAWSCVVAARIAVDRHRRAKTRESLLGRLRVHRATVHLDPDAALTESVRQALLTLDPDLRATVVLRYYADLSVADIARALGLPEGTVKSRLHRANSLLRNELQEDR